jgi:hypothetical protein
MAKKIPKIPIPRARTKLSAWDKFYAGIAGLSPYFGKARLHQSMSKATESGRAARAAQRADMIRKYGKGAMRVGRVAGLLNPWAAVPYALFAGAKYGVGKAFDPYRDETGKIGTEGHARLAMEARAREQGIRKEDMDLESFLKTQQELELNRPTYAQLRESFLARQNQSEGGIARLL